MDPRAEAALVSLGAMQAEAARLNKQMRDEFVARMAVIEDQRARVQVEIEKLEPMAVAGLLPNESMVKLAMLWDTRRHYDEEWVGLREAIAQLVLFGEDEEVTVAEPAEVLDASIVVE